MAINEDSIAQQIDDIVDDLEEKVFTLEEGGIPREEIFKRIKNEYAARNDDSY